MPVEARTHGNESSEMRVLLSTYGSRGNVAPMVELAVRLQALGANLPRRVAEGCDALAASDMMPAGVWL
jgi:vancomycin aglycone glucosyltransferase